MTGKITGPLREQSDWAQNDEHRLGFIKNKPFYDNRKSEPLTIEWDGNTKNKESFYLATNQSTYYKISENVPSYDEVLQGEGTFYVNATGEEGSTQEIPFSLVETTTEITDSNGNNVWMVEVVDGVALIIVPNSFVLGEVEATRGIWAFHAHEAYEDGTVVDLFIKNLFFPSITTGELKTIDPKYLPSGSTSATPDFAQNDPTAADYIKNRPFYEETDSIELLTDFAVDEYGNYGVASFALIPNQAYDIIWNSTLYENVICRGASHSQGISVFDTEGNELRIYRLNGDNVVCIDNSSGKSCTVSLSTTGTVVHGIDQKYLPFYETQPIYDVVISEKTFYDEDYVTNEDGSVVVSTPFERLGYESADDLNEMWFIVTLDGIEYNVQFKQVYSSYGYMGGEGYPFTIATQYNGDSWDVSFLTGGEHTLKVVSMIIPGEIVHIDEKFIPDTIARISDLPAYQSIVYNKDYFNVEEEIPLEDYTYIEDGDIYTTDGGYYNYTDLVPFNGAPAPFELILDDKVYYLHSFKFINGGDYWTVLSCDGTVSLDTNDFIILQGPSRSIYRSKHLLPSKISRSLLDECILRQIDEKLIPDTIARTSDIIDLTQYVDENGTSVADKMMSDFMTCVQSGTSFIYDSMEGGNIFELCNLLHLKKDLTVSIPYGTVVINAKEMNYNTKDGKMYSRTFNLIYHQENNSITFIIASLIPAPDRLQFELYLK
jgi:hypothetical protein